MFERQNYTENKKVKEVRNKLGYDTDTGMQDGKLYFTKLGFLFNLYTERTHWVGYKDQTKLDFYCLPLPKRITVFAIRPREPRFMCGHKIQRSDSYCATYRFYNFYPTDFFKSDFISALLHIYHNEKRQDRK